MANENNLAIDESRRLARHEAVKDEIRDEVQAEIEQQTNTFSADEQFSAAVVGDQLKKKAFNEVVSTETELDRARGLARASQVVDYLFYLIYGIIGLEILLDLMGARRGIGFRNLIDTISRPLLAPFEALVPSMSSGRFRLQLSYIFALVVYILLHFAINAFLRMLAHRKTEI